MQYVRIDRNGVPVWGVVQGACIRTLTMAPYDGICYDGGALPLAECTLLAPCTPSKIVCIGKNYYDHAVEMGEGVPECPVLFLKAPNTVNRPEGAIHAPAFVQRLDYEGELAIVIKRRAKDVTPEHAADYILGCTCLNDVTARDIQKGDGQWSRGKSMDGFAPIGPLVTDEVNWADLAIQTRLNGSQVQESRTSRLMHPVPELLAFITASMTLEPGDVIATGTPAGVGSMHPGDTVEVEIEGVGILRNRIV